MTLETDDMSGGRGLREELGPVIGLLATLVAAVASAALLLDRVRLPEIIALAGTSFGAGAFARVLVQRWRGRRRGEGSHPAPRPHSGP